MAEEIIVPNYRHELKYIVSSAEIELLKIRLNGIMQKDSHVLGKGIYNIRSMYYDDYSNRCFYENENGDDPRAKYRIRIYNHSSDRISLELKGKQRGKTLKKSCQITYDQAIALIEKRNITNIDKYHRLLQGLYTDIMVNLMRPVVIVDYDRIPYIYKNGNVRITFDTNICSSRSFGGFFDENIPKRPILPTGMHILEVKFDEYLPDIIYQCLNLQKLQQTAFSKFYLCRKYAL